MKSKKYGWDNYSTFLLFVAVAFLINRYTVSVSCLLILYVLYRTFSKNAYRRTFEKQGFEQAVLKIYSALNLNQLKDKFSNRNIKKSEKANYKFFKCPHCKSKLRVPRNKGKIKITCTNCHEQFIAKT